MVLHNCETWNNISRKTFRILNNFFNYFFRSIFRCSSGAPKPNFYWQTGSLRVENLILQKKLVFFHHLSSLPVESLAGEVFKLQLEKNIDGLVTDCKEHILKMGNTNPKEVSKYMWKKRTRLYVTEKNKNDLLEDIKGYKKLDYNELSKENFERKKYFFEQNIDDVRIMFKIKSEVLPTVRKNFSRKYRKQTLTCPSCRNISSPKEDTQKHLMLECPTFAS